MASSPKHIDLSPEQADILVERIRSKTLDEKDCETLIALIQTVLVLYRTLSQKSHSIQRLLRRIFGVKTESAGRVLKESATPGAPSQPPQAASKGRAGGKRGHGRNGADHYQGLERISVAHQSLKSGDPCRLCPKGKVYKMAEPKILIRMSGQAPIGGNIFDLERLRCNLCGAIFTADPPQGVGADKYDATSGSIVCVLKYGAGLPFYRLEKLQESLSVPLPASTQWDMVEGVADKVHPALRELIRQGAQGEILHNDDTTARVLSLMKEIKEEEKGSRRGIFTTGVLSLTQGRKIALFFTGRKHAGENLKGMLEQRARDLPVPIQMCDALERNVPEGLKTVLCNCLSTAARESAKLGDEKSVHPCSSLYFELRSYELNLLQ